jgi:lipopolysaccharide transport system permease protein
MSLVADENLRTIEPAPRPSEDDSIAAGSPLAEKPFVVIEPGPSWAAVSLRDLWAYRELLYFLIWRDVKVRYKQTVVGVAWIVAQPLLTTLIFTLIFGVLAGVPSDGVPYAVFAFAGLLPWMFFSGAVTRSGDSLVGSANLITKVYFPRVIIPCAAIGAGLLDFAISLAVLGVLMAYYRVAPTAGLLMLPALLLLVMIFSLGMGMWLSALNVKYRDVRHLLPFLLQIWMYASPVIYPPTFVPERWRWLLKLNPMTGIIDGFRAAIFGGKSFDWFGLASSTIIALALLVYAAFTFRRMERSFADIV